MQAAAAFFAQISEPLIEVVLMWIACGVAVLLSSDVAAYLDMLRFIKLRKRGRLPSPQAEVIAIAVAIVAWPKLARRML